MHQFQENLPARVQEKDLIAFSRLLEGATDTLRPTISLGVVSLTEGTVTFNNLIGEGVAPGGARFTICPKGVVGEKWIYNVSQFFTSNTRFYLSPVPSGSEAALPYLPAADAIALEFAAELELAFKVSGPIIAHSFSDRSLKSLKGKLNVSKWVIDHPIRPTSFPVFASEVDAENIYNRVFSLAIQTVLRKVSGHTAASALKRASRTVALPPVAESFTLPVVRLPRLPVQWAAYSGAWELAEMILRQRVGEAGGRNKLGVSFLVEPWRLLENALERLMAVIAGLAGDVVPQVQAQLPFLNWKGKPTNRGRSVIPDGMLIFKNGVRASFECKYSLLSENSLPNREHSFQALATANTVGAQVAFLILPGSLPLREIELYGRFEEQIRFFVLGIDLFNDNVGNQIEILAARILHICRQVEVK